MSVTGIILAAGQSRRLGRPKQILPFGDTTVLGRTVANAEASSLERILVVLGAVRDDVVAALAPTRAEIVPNERFELGPLSSVLAGLDAAGACDAVMLLLGDMPTVDAMVIDTVASAWRRLRPWAAATSYRGDLAHPLVFSAAAFATLRGLTGERPVWDLITRRSEDVLAIAVDRPVPGDIDTWEDYQQAQRALHGSPGPPGP